MHVAPIAIPLLVRGARVSVFLHGVESWRPLSTAERCVVARSDRVIANSHHTADRFTDCNRWFKRTAVEVCPLGIPSIPQQDIERSADNAALMVGRMSSEDRYKGHERVIRAWPLVRAHVADAELVLVGDGDDRRRLEQTAREAGVGDSVRFVGDVREDELDGWYRRCAFFVLPSDREGFGLVLLEAMRAGKACIAAPGAAAEVVVDEVTGLLVAADDQGALATAMTRLFLNRELRARFGRNGQARFRQTFTSRHFADRLRLLIAGPIAPRHAA
jgi:glycosyltransferase involved in cell wall biosynthesis